MSASGTPALIYFAIATTVLAAAVPAFLSIGEGAKKQQEGFEANDRVMSKASFGKNKSNSGGRRR